MPGREARRWKSPDRERGRDHGSGGCETQIGSGRGVDPGIHRVDLSGTGAGEKNHEVGARLSCLYYGAGCNAGCGASFKFLKKPAGKGMGAIVAPVPISP